MRRSRSIRLPVVIHTHLPVVAALLLAFGSTAARGELLTYLTLDGTVEDSGPAGNDGMFYGELDPLFEEGYDGTPMGAISLDGVDDYIELTPNEGLPLTHMPQFSIAMWVKGFPQTDKRVFSESSNGSGTPIWNIGTHNTAADGTVDSYIRSSAGNPNNHEHSVATAFDGSWHHIAWVDDNGDVTLYVDGVADATDFDYPRPPQEFVITTIGGIYRPGHSLVYCCFFQGAIDDVQLYDSLLTQAEVSVLASRPCDPVADTTCDDILVAGPPGNEPGIYTVSSPDAVDLSGDAIYYLFRADDGAGTVLESGALLVDTTTFQLGAGTWTISVTVEDDLTCVDSSPNDTCTTTVVVVPCPTAGDTTCSGVNVVGPAGNAPGTYEVSAAAADASGDPILYTYTAQRGSEAPIVKGPYAGVDTILLTLGPGTWTISVTVDDNPYCDDVAASSTCSTSLEVVTPAPALVSHWRFDGDLADERPAGNDGTYQGFAGAPFYAEGFDDADPGAVLLNGVDELVEVTQNEGLPIYANRAYTVAMWVKGPSFQVDRRVFSEGNALGGIGTAPPHPLGINPLFNIGTHNAGTDGTVDIYIRNDTGAAPVAHRHGFLTAFDDTWHHIAWVDDDGNARLFVDAVRDPTDFRYTRGTLTLDTTTIGAILRALPSHWFSGSIDGVRVYNHALSEAEIEALVPDGPGCPGDADTTVGDLLVSAPAGNLPGFYTLTASGAVDGTGDPILYTFVAEGPDAAYFQQGPDVLDSATFTLFAGAWKLTVKVDDDIRCQDRSPQSAVTKQITVIAPPRELVSHWRMDGSLDDWGAAGNDGYTVGGGVPVFGADVDGKAGSALCLAGTNEEIVSAAISADLPINNKVQFAAYSIAMWVNGLPQPDRRVYAETSSTDNNTMFTLGTANTGTTGAFDLFVRTAAGTVVVNHRHSTGIAFDGTWHHVAWVDRNGAAVLYIDGEPDATDFTYAKPYMPQLDTVAIGGIVRGGGTNLSYPFTGCLDDVRVYNHALTQEEVSAIMDGGGPVESVFRRGDADADGVVNITDAIYVLNYLFQGGSEPECLDAADADDEFAINITDGIYILGFLFLGGQEPPAPGPFSCGPDTPAEDGLDCQSYGAGC